MLLRPCQSVPKIMKLQKLMESKDIFLSNILLPMSTVNKELTTNSTGKNNLFRKKKGLQSSTYSLGGSHKREQEGSSYQKGKRS